MSIFEVLKDRDSEPVQYALTRRCEVCKAKPGNDCMSLIDGQPLTKRIVHYARATAP